MVIAGWMLVLLLLAAWSGLVWAGQALLAGLLSQAGEFDAGSWRLPEALTAWLPTPVAEWLAVALETWAPQLQALVGMLPVLSGGVAVLAWMAWGAGALLLLVAGVAVHVAVALWRKSRLSPVPQPVALLR